MTIIVRVKTDKDIKSVHKKVIVEPWYRIFICHLLQVCSMSCVNFLICAILILLIFFSIKNKSASSSGNKCSTHLVGKFDQNIFSTFTRKTMSYEILMKRFWGISRTIWIIWIKPVLRWIVSYSKIITLYHNMI